MTDSYDICTICFIINMLLLRVYQAIDTNLSLIDHLWIYDIMKNIFFTFHMLLI